MTQARPLSVMVVSYAFPPVGGAGVQRVTKLVKYLRGVNVRCEVLTVSNPSVPVRDASLEADVPPDTRVIRARTLEPGYGLKREAWAATAGQPAGLVARAKRRIVALARELLVPDPQVLWLPAAAAALAGRLAGSEPPDVVFVSGPPFSAFLLAPLARLGPATAIVLDYRDEWTTARGSYEMGGGAHVGALLEAAVVRRADAITTATGAFRDELLRRFPFLSPDRVHVVPNGYDPDDFPSPLPAPPADRFVLSYVGTVFRLTSARALLDAVRLLHDRDPALARLLEVRFIGRIVETEASYFEGTERLGVFRSGYLEHRDALGELARSHLVACILADVPGAERIYPAKVFEILYLGRPCLALSGEGALAEFVREHAMGEVVPPGDPEAIYAALRRRVAAFRDGGYATGSTAATQDVLAFHRQRQAERFAAIFRDAVRVARSRRATRKVRATGSASSASERSVQAAAPPNNSLRPYRTA